MRDTIDWPEEKLDSVLRQAGLDSDSRLDLLDYRRANEAKYRPKVETEIAVEPHELPENVQVPVESGGLIDVPAAQLCYIAIADVTEEAYQFMRTTIDWPEEKLDSVLRQAGLDSDSRLDLLDYRRANEAKFRTEKESRNSIKEAEGQVEHDEVKAEHNEQIEFSNVSEQQYIKMPAFQQRELVQSMAYLNLIELHEGLTIPLTQLFIDLGTFENLVKRPEFLHDSTSELVKQVRETMLELPDEQIISLFQTMPPALRAKLSFGLDESTLRNILYHPENDIFQYFGNARNLADIILVSNWLDGSANSGSASYVHTLMDDDYLKDLAQSMTSTYDRELGSEGLAELLSALKTSRDRLRASYADISETALMDMDVDLVIDALYGKSSNTVFEVRGRRDLLEVNVLVDALNEDQEKVTLEWLNGVLDTLAQSSGLEIEDIEQILGELYIARSSDLPWNYTLGRSGAHGERQKVVLSGIFDIDGNKVSPDELENQAATFFHEFAHLMDQKQSLTEYPSDTLPFGYGDLASDYVRDYAIGGQYFIMPDMPHLSSAQKRKVEDLFVAHDGFQDSKGNFDWERAKEVEADFVFELESVFDEMMFRLRAEDYAETFRIYVENKGFKGEMGTFDSELATKLGFSQAMQEKFRWLESNIRSGITSTVQKSQNRSAANGRSNLIQGRRTYLQNVPFNGLSQTTKLGRVEHAVHRHTTMRRRNGRDANTHTVFVKPDIATRSEKIAGRYFQSEVASVSTNFTTIEFDQLCADIHALTNTIDGGLQSFETRNASMVQQHELEAYLNAYLSAEEGVDQVRVTMLKTQKGDANRIDVTVAFNDSHPLHKNTYSATETMPNEPNGGIKIKYCEDAQSPGKFRFASCFPVRTN